VEPRPCPASSTTHVPRTRTDADALRALLARRMEEAAADAVRADGEVPGERLDALARLIRLVEMREAASASGRSRWAVPAVAVTTLVCASVLFFARVSSTDVAIELNVSEVDFVTPTVQVLSDAVSLSALGISGLLGIELPAAGAQMVRHPESDLFVTTARVAGRAGTVNFDPITVAAGTHVTLRKLDGRGHYELVIGGRASDLAAAVNGPVRIVVPTTTNEVRVFQFPRRISLEPDSGEVRLDLTVAADSGARGPLWSPLPVERVVLSRIDEFQGSGQTVLRRVSTIRSGTLYFESIDGRAQPLRAGEELHFTKSSGEFREWRMDDDGIVVRFRGTVHGMSTGSEGTRRSLMPTMLDWLRARHGVSLLWGSTAYAVGLFVTVLGWFKRQP